MKRHFDILILVLLGFLVYFAASFLVNWNHYLTGLFVSLAAVGLYFAYVFGVDCKNYMSFKGLFSLVWLGCTGLASLRLANYQIPWEAKTWYLLGASYVFLILGLYCGECLFPVLARKFDLSKARCFQRDKKIVYGLKKERLFWIVLVVTLISLVALIINYRIKGYLPFFSSDQNAYVDFYTRWYIFVFAGTTVVGLAYYCIRKLELARTKKTIMYLCIAYLILMPILVVSRGAFVTAALSLSATIFFLHKRKFWVLLLCLIFIFGGYQVGSLARNLTDDYLNTVLEPKEIVIANDGQSETQQDQGQQPQNQPEQENPPTPEKEEKTFQLPASVAFLYTYLTVGHDNFNQAVTHSQYMAWGIHQVLPFNVLLRSSFVTQKLATTENYLIRDYLNTGNLFSDAYYDFHAWGIILFGLLWGLCFGMIEAFFLKYQTPGSYMAVGNTLTPIMLCFFVSWMSVFSLWLIWGTAFLVFIISCFTLQVKENKKGIEEKKQ